MNQTDPAAPPRIPLPKLFAFFALAYVVQGFAQASGILYQPLQYYFKSIGKTPTDIETYIFWITFPWYLKPIYGLITDFLPILGSPRKLYLYGLSLVGVLAFGLATQAPTELLVVMVVLTSLTTAAADVVVDALMVEHGQARDKVRAFQTTQWAAVSATGMLAAWGGGQIAEHFKANPRDGVNLALWISAAGPLMIGVITVLFIRERKRRLDLDGLHTTGLAVRDAVTHRALIGVTLFVFLFQFQPGYGTPWYFVQTDHLKFSQAFIGELGIPTYAGYLLGVGLFGVLGQLTTARVLAAISAVAYAASFCLDFQVVVTPHLWDHWFVRGVVFLQGTAYMFANLTLLSLAAGVCPKRAEAFTFAAIMAIFNLSQKTSNILGAKLFDGPLKDAFPDDMAAQVRPLIALSAGFTLATLAFLWLLPKDEKPKIGTTPADGPAADTPAIR